MSDKAEKYAQWIVANADKKGTPEFETVAKAYKLAKEEKPSEFRQQLNELADIGVGAIGEGAKFLGRFIPGTTGEKMQAATERALTPKGYTLNPEAVSTGRVGADIGVSFAGPAVLGKVASKIPAAVKYAEALSSGGMNLGQAATGSKIANALMRTGVGAAEGYGTGTLINPDEAWKGAIAQGAFAGATPLAAELLNRGAKRLMMSAIKPAKSELESGAGQRAVNTMLEEGVNPTLNRTIFGRGLDTLENKIGELNNQISTIIQNSKGNVSKSQVIGYLDDLLDKAKYSLAPESDMAAVQAVKDQFIAHPLATNENIPIQLAQKLKQGTYKSIGTKNFNEIGGYTKEALRAGAKGLKEGVASAEPSVAALNAKEGDLINALDVAESRAYQALKNNPAGIAGLANDPAQFALMMADRSDAFKALIARMMYQTGKGVRNINQVPMGTVPAAIATQGEQ